MTATSTSSTTVSHSTPSINISQYRALDIPFHSLEGVGSEMGKWSHPAFVLSEQDCSTAFNIVAYAPTNGALDKRSNAPAIFALESWQ
jgi:hypothetical protein